MVVYDSQCLMHNVGYLWRGIEVVLKYLGQNLYLLIWFVFSVDGSDDELV